ncbi:MAG: hypothetical protein KKC01_05590 [Gammaproteobacteria bacterium]|nr:hypothetical protein [Gammaproteobacteria bacterium]
MRSATVFFAPTLLTLFCLCCRQDGRSPDHVIKADAQLALPCAPIILCGLRKIQIFIMMADLLGAFSIVVLPRCGLPAQWLIHMPVQPAPSTLMHGSQRFADVVDKALIVLELLHQRGHSTDP